MRKELVALKQALAEVENHQLKVGKPIKSMHCGPKLTELELANFENKHGVELSASYRSYLSNISNGSVGPGFGILPLQRWHAGLETVPESDQILRQPCLLRTDVAQAPYDWLDEVGPSDWEDKLNDGAWSPYQGCITLADLGCCSYYVISLNGPYSDRVWYVDHDFNPPKLRPEINFVAWLLAWATKFLDSQADSNLA